MQIVKVFLFNLKNFVAKKVYCLITVQKQVLFSNSHKQCNIFSLQNIADWQKHLAQNLIQVIDDKKLPTLNSACDRRQK